MFIKSNQPHRGFTLYETIIALMVTIMTLGILQQSLQILKIIQRTDFQEQVRWHITQEKLQIVLQNSKIINLKNQRIVYSPNNEQNKRVIEKYWAGDKLMLHATTVSSGGHEPIMTGLRKINIEKNGNLVIITTENKAQQKSTMCLVYDE